MVELNACSVMIERPPVVCCGVCAAAWCSTRHMLRTDACFNTARQPIAQSSSTSSCPAPDRCLPVSRCRSTCHGILCISHRTYALPATCALHLLVCHSAGAAAPAVGWHQLCQHHSGAGALAAAAGAAAVQHGDHLHSGGLRACTGAGQVRCCCCCSLHCIKCQSMRGLATANVTFRKMLSSRQYSMAY